MLRRHTNRASDLAARYGGEEFAIIASGMSKAESQAFAQGLCQDIASLEIDHQHSPYQIVTVSIGIAWHQLNNDVTSDEIIKAADLNLYQAKNQGRNRAY